MVNNKLLIRPYFRGGTLGGGVGWLAVTKLIELNSSLSFNWDGVEPWQLERDTDEVLFNIWRTRIYRSIPGSFG